MKIDVEIRAGKIQEPGSSVLRAFVSLRKDGQYRIEIRGCSQFTRQQRSKAHIWMHSIEQHTGQSIESQKIEYCKSLGWGEWKPWRNMTAQGEIVETQIFVRKRTEEMDEEMYRQLLVRVQVVGDFLGLILE